MVVRHDVVAVVVVVSGTPVPVYSTVVVSFVRGWVPVPTMEDSLAVAVW